MKRRTLMTALVLVSCVLLIPGVTVLAEAQSERGHVAERGAALGQALAKGARVKCSATVRYPLPGRGGTQTVYIRVTDGAGRGLPGASVRLLVRQRNGDRWLWAPPTNAAGDSVCVFPLSGSPAGYTVLIEIIAHWQGHYAKAYTSYKPCW